MIKFCCALHFFSRLFAVLLNADAPCDCCEVVQFDMAGSSTGIKRQDAESATPLAKVLRGSIAAFLDTILSKAILFVRTKKCPNLYIYISVAFWLKCMVDARNYCKCKGGLLQSSYFWDC